MFLLRYLQGVIHLLVPQSRASPDMVESSFATQLANALEFTMPPAGAMACVIIAPVVHLCALKSGPLRRAEKDPWAAVYTAFTTAATRFKKEHGRPVVLVIDGVDFLAEPNEKSLLFVKSLLDAAKVLQQKSGFRPLGFRVSGLGR